MGGGRGCELQTFPSLFLRFTNSSTFFYFPTKNGSQGKRGYLCQHLQRLVLPSLLFDLFILDPNPSFFSPLFLCQLRALWSCRCMRVREGNEIERMTWKKMVMDRVRAWFAKSPSCFLCFCFGSKGSRHQAFPSRIGSVFCHMVWIGGGRRRPLKRETFEKPFLYRFYIVLLFFIRE
ncbi:hypothetical protein DM02DRAFT_53734 [Periconia macrospinosa]|uniref:Uncharacterized protein n=1 Tax=Periconia macrospinosa TaxID=97972 RepID=A0A2V1E5J9_9PLEO|nr:hypothetical protein DM02DRAFT_53734 [Periconia macrospinosa]